MYKNQTLLFFVVIIMIIIIITMIIIVNLKRSAQYVYLYWPLWVVQALEATTAPMSTERDL